MLVGQLTPDPNGNANDPVKQCWLTWDIKTANDSTYENHGFFLKARVVGLSRGGKGRLNLDTLSPGLHRAAWEPMAKELWRRKFSKYIEAQEEFRLAILKAGKKNTKPRKAATNPSTDAKPFERDEKLEKELFDVSRKVSFTKLQEFAVYLQRSTQITQAPTVKEMELMRLWSDVSGKPIFESPDWIGHCKGIGQYPPPKPPGGLKRTREETEVSGGSGDGREDSKRVKLPDVATEWYTTITGMQLKRSTKTLVVVDAGDQCQIEQMLQGLQNLRLRLSTRST